MSSFITHANILLSDILYTQLEVSLQHVPHLYYEHHKISRHIRTPNRPAIRGDRERTAHLLLAHRLAGPQRILYVSGAHRSDIQLSLSRTKQLDKHEFYSPTNFPRTFKPQYPC